MSEVNQVSEVTEVQETNIDKANKFVKEQTAEQVVVYLASLLDNIDELKNNKLYWQDSYYAVRQKHDNFVDRTTEFIKECLSNNSVDLDDLKSFAEENDISLTRTIEVTMNISYTAKIEIGLDDDEPTEDDFNIEISYQGNSDVEDENHEVDDFNTEDI